MKKAYESPVVEKVDFDYEDNVVASGSIVETKDGVKNCWCCNVNPNPKPTVYTWWPFIFFCCRRY
ncbi:hypothetical protein JNO48_12485 [Clostridiales bacterium]|nr:hypothetical protein JNO48_12485 [Clostridiales bacterium]